MWQVLLRSFSIALLLSGAVFAQSQPGESLGDVARTKRAEQQAQEAAGTMPKVITNQDLPAAPPGVPESSPSDPMSMVSGVKRSDGYADQRLTNRPLAEQRAAQQWRARIQAQGNKVAALQAHVDRMNALLNPVGGVQYEGPYSRYQARQRERLEQMQEMLNQEKQRLYAMQEEARRVGMHTSVYDP
ncbi:MAG TPA: hypothetical protein VEG68_16760 [Terriglobales bacterium]|nr:hypothetical protein [Terriglobales bacterium]